MKRLVIAMALLAYMSCVYGSVKNVIIGGNDHAYEVNDVREKMKQTDGLFK